MANVSLFSVFSLFISTVSDVIVSDVRALRKSTGRNFHETSSHRRICFGMLAFAIDSKVILAPVFVFGEIQASVYGAAYTVVTSVSLNAVAAMKKLGLPTA